MTDTHRQMIACEDARVLAHEAWAGGQYVLRLAAPHCAASAVPGSFIHLQCDPEIPMRRPLSIMRADPVAGWIEVLYKVVGTGLAALCRVREGELRSVLGPVGNGFSPDPHRPRALLIGGGVGIPPLVFLAERLAAGGAAQHLALFGSELPFPFGLAGQPRPVVGMPADATAAMGLLEELGVPSRLASRAGLPGCHDGYVTDLAECWIAATTPERCAIYACGPEPMLRAVARLAHRHGLPAQLCLEEYMACAVGGCAGCAIPVLVDGQREMKRVCVDGPVFAAASVYPAASAA